MGRADEPVRPTGSYADQSHFSQDHGAQSHGAQALAPDSALSIRVLDALLAAVEEAGVPRIDLLRAAGADITQRERIDMHMPRSQLQRVCELAIELTGNPALALYWQQGISERALGPLAHMVAYADSLRHGLDIVARFGRLVSAGPLYQLTEHAAEATLCVVPQEAPGGACKRFASDMRLVGFLRMLRAFDDHMRVVRVHLAHPAPSYAQEYARVFESPIHFEAGFTGIVFERDLLDASSSYRDEDICHALQAVAQQRMARSAKRLPYALRVRELLKNSPAQGAARLGMPAVAEALGVSVRSLRRHLTVEGTTYPLIVSEVRSQVAKQMLSNHGLTVEETAHAMGFSDAATFHRAFKSWTGTTPGAYRNAH